MTKIFLILAVVFGVIGLAISEPRISGASKALCGVALCLYAMLAVVRGLERSDSAH